MGLYKPAPARLTLVIPALCAGAGFAIVLAALDVIPVAPDRLESPRWVVGAAGLAFVLAGLAIWSGEPSPDRPWARLRAQAFGAGIVGCMAAVANWIAFGPGERRFSGTTSLPFFSFSSRASEWLGRAVFGLGAVFLDLFFLWATAHGIRDLLRAARRAPGVEGRTDRDPHRQA